MNESEPNPQRRSLIHRQLPLWQLVLLLAFPVWIQQMLHMTVNLSDRMLAGRFLELSGEDAARQIAYQSAQTTAGYLYWLINSFAVLVSAGSTALVARFVGAGDWKKAIHTTNQSLLLAMIFGAIGSLLGWFFIHDLVGLLQLKGDAAKLAADYLRPLFAGLTLQITEQVGIACLIGAGDTLASMVVLSGVAILNVPLAWSFFKGLGPFPEMGFIGITTGTTTSHALGCIAVLTMLAYGRAGLQLDFQLWRPNRALIRRILRISVPAALDSLSLMAWQFFFLAIVNRLGDVASAAHGIALQWEALGYQSGNAFAVAAMALVGQNLGAKRPDVAARSGWTAYALGTLVMTFMAVIFFVFAPEMFYFFCPNPEQQPIVDQGVPVLRLIAFTTPMIASITIFTGTLRGAGDTRVPLIFTWVGFVAIRIPLALAFTLWLNWGLFGAWLAMCADLLVRGVAFLWRFASGKWQTIHV
jgi:putative MATE family efflux protein